MGETMLPFVMGYLPELYQRKAEMELYDTQERRTQALRQMRELIKKDKCVRNFILEDYFILQYLRVRKYNVPRAFSQLRSAALMRKRNPKMFTDMHFDIMVRTQTEKGLTFLPWRCHDGCAILLIQVDHWDPDTFSVEEVKRAFVLYLLQSLKDPMTQVNGVKVILDVKSNPARHLRHATPDNLYLIYHGLQNCIPLRYKEVHVVNKSVVFKICWVIVKPFISDKMKRRIIFHDSPDTLLNYFSKDVLPKEFGGDLENYDMTDWLRQMMTPEQLNLLPGVPVVKN